MATETPPHTEAQKVFICYRREDSAPYAGRIYDAMVARFGVENVFMDLDLAPGVDFIDRITRVVSGCVALIVVIGPSWAKLQNEDGTRRIEDPDDFVRLEVETGLRRDDVTAIPVLVGGARMPRREDLPAELQGITRRNALEMSDGRWRYDVGRLLSTLDELLPESAEVGGATAPPPPPAPRQGLPDLGWRLVLEGAAVAGAAGLVGRWLAEAILEFEAAFDDEPDGEMIRHIWTELARRTGTLALVGAALAIWLALRVIKTPPTRLLVKGALLGGLAGLAGGLIWTLPVYQPPDKAEFTERATIELVSLAVSGGLLGMLIGSLWRPRRRAAAFGVGAIAGFAFALFVLAVSWKTKTPGERVWFSGLAVALIAGSTLATMRALDRAEARERRPNAGAG